jgi:hypothetical protein
MKKDAVGAGSQRLRLAPTTSTVRKDPTVTITDSDRG